jgi:hypothetical protein
MQSIATNNGTAVLMARIVDHAGVGIRPEMVAAIAYSLCELTCDGPTVVAGHCRVLLETGEVMYDAMQTDGLWSADVSGYNFRHELDFVPASSRSRVARHFALVYEFIAPGGERSIIHFQIRGTLP